MIQAEIAGVRLELETAPGVFSPTAVDRGTLAMLAKVTLGENEKVLDLGCGCGAVGIWCTKQGAQVTCCDIDPVCVELTRRNALHNGVPGITTLHSDGLDAVIDGGYTLILSNPPYHTDFSVPKRFIEQGWRKLAPGGRLFMVTKRRDWYKNKIISIFGGVRIHELDGYFVFEAHKTEKTKRPRVKTPKQAMSKKLRRKYDRKG